MVASTGQKARLFDLMIEVGDLVREGHRDADEVLRLLQDVKDGKLGVLHGRLRPVGEVQLPARTEPFDPKVFFRTREGLWVWDKFVDRVLSVVNPTEAALEATLQSFDLVLPASDKKIRAELPEGHAFDDAGVFSANLAGMIGRQPNGEQGDLLTSGYANIFYVRGLGDEVFAVDVDWDSHVRGWRVVAGSLGHFRWGAGRRVFSSNC
ncbi:MAG: hypothetical protein Q8P01_05725 [bacterium]|nr:hypothetical protein [bacterium]